jgi:hypothetical protein
MYYSELVYLDSAYFAHIVTYEDNMRVEHRRLTLVAAENQLLESRQRACLSATTRN